jgi:hypothetical protein
MPFRFRRSFGGLIRINLSKTGVSVSAGVPGAHINYDLSHRRKKPTRVTVGIPGTGLSYYEDMGLPNGKSTVPNGTIPGPQRSTLGTVLGWILLIAVVSFIVFIAFLTITNA